MASERDARCSVAQAQGVLRGAAHPRGIRFVATLTALVVAAAALTPSLGARGNWYDPYLDGLSALERGDEERAVALFELALDRKPTSGYHRTYGTNFIHYTPHAQLAMALGRLGRCERALEEVARAEQAGEPGEIEGLDIQLEAVRKDCAPAPAPTPLAPPASTAAPPPDPPRLADPALLNQGLGAYLSGDLDRAARLFAQAAERGPDSAIAPLMLAASLHGTWSATGRSDQKLRARAISALEQAARRDPRLSPPASLLPPDFVALYQSVQQRVATN